MVDLSPFRRCSTGHPESVVICCDLRCQCFRTGGESGILSGPLVQTLCVQQNAADRSPYRHLRSITSGTVVTEETLINPTWPHYGMDGMDSVLRYTTKAHFRTNIVE